MHILNGLGGPQFLNVKWNQNLLDDSKYRTMYYIHSIMGSRHATGSANESDKKAWSVYVTDMDIHTSYALMCF